VHYLLKISDKSTQAADPDASRVLGWALSPEATTLYQALLATPDRAIAPGDLAAKELIEAQFARPDWEDPTHLLLLPPDVAITRVIAQRVRGWLNDLPDLEAAGRAISAYSRLLPSATTDPAPLATSTGRQQASTMLVASARRELCLMQPYPEWMTESVRDDPEVADAADTEVLARGVSHRFLYDERILADAHFRMGALEEVDQGVHARVTGTLPTWMMIADGTAALYLPDPASADGASTNESGLVALLQMAFDTAWAGARPLDATRSASDLTNQHREVLMLIIAGHPIGAIARLMKLDVKTVRRRTTDLCDYFHVSDRTGLLNPALVRPM
jgi:DNA-binding CsgD family transcriptional regulator